MNEYERDALRKLAKMIGYYGPLFRIAQRVLTKSEFREIVAWTEDDRPPWSQTPRIKRLLETIRSKSSAEDRRRMIAMMEANYDRGTPGCPVHHKPLIDDENPSQQMALRCWEDEG